MNVIITPSNNQNKKFTAIINNIKKIHFGDSRYQDFTITKDDKKRKLIYLDIKMIKLIIQIMRASTVPIYYGINQP